MTCSAKRLAVSLGIFFLPTLIALPATAQSERYVLVEGMGSVQAAPDRATVSAGVQSRGATAAEAMRANAEAMRAALSALAEAGLPQSAIQTSQLTVYPVFDRPDPEGGRRAPVAYEATNLVEATVSHIETVGSVIDALVSAGVNRIQGVRFSIANAVALEDEARRLAVADAQRKATVLAQAAGVALGDALQLEERGGGGPVPAMRMTMEASLDTPVAPGEQTVSAGVSIRFAIVE